MKKLIVICLVLVTGALSAQDNPKSTAKSQRKDAKMGAKKDVPPVEIAPAPSPSESNEQAPEPAGRSISEKGLSTKTAAPHQQSNVEVQPKNSMKTEEKPRARPQ